MSEEAPIHWFVKSDTDIPMRSYFGSSNVIKRRYTMKGPPNLVGKPGSKKKRIYTYVDQAACAHESDELTWPPPKERFSYNPAEVMCAKCLRLIRDKYYADTHKPCLQCREHEDCQVHEDLGREMPEETISDGNAKIECSIPIRVQRAASK